MYIIQIILMALSVFVILTYGPRFAKLVSKLSLTSPATIVVAATFFSIASSIVLGNILGIAATSLNTFQFFSFSKMIILPLVYLIFVLALTRFKRNTTQSILSLPIWFWALLGTLFISSIAAIVIPRQQIVFTPSVQGLGLVIGFLLFIIIGNAPDHWSLEEKTAFITLILLAGVFASVANADLGPFSPITIPSGVILLWLGTRYKNQRYLFFAMAVLLIAPVVNEKITLANLSQLGIGLFLVLLFGITKQLRRIILSVCTIFAVIGAVFTGLLNLLLGNASGITDVTLSHRAYETFNVWQQNLSSPISTLFGLGPSSTIDLSQSPDVTTLLWSGRDVFRVDDVHFITSWIVLKFGVFGFISLMALYLWLFIQLMKFIGETKHIDPFLGSIWILVLCGIAFGSPAATYIFTYPLIGVGLGILIRSRVKHGHRPFSEQPKNMLGIGDNFKNLLGKPSKTNEV